MHVVTSAMITIMVNTFGDRMPKSNPIFSTINSTNPRVFIKAPKATASFRPREKEQMAFDAGFADARPASPAAGCSKWQPTILPLPRQWERGGVRVAWKKKFAKSRFAPD